MAISSNLGLKFNRLSKDECPVDTLRACVFIYLPYILKNNVQRCFERAMH